MLYPTNSSNEKEDLIYFLIKPPKGSRDKPLQQLSHLKSQPLKSFALGPFGGKEFTFHFLFSNFCKNILKIINERFCRIYAILIILFNRVKKRYLINNILNVQKEKPFSYHFMYIKKRIELYNISFQSLYKLLQKA